MKVKTNSGEVTLTAEMVSRGMVFENPAGIQYTHDEYRDMAAMARELHDGNWRFLGCNPEVATRADCERFGVYGDAAAHGFARLRDRGALDLRRHLPGGWVIQNADGTYNAGIRPWRLPEGARFIGLDADHASTKYVQWLCCGAEHLSNEQYDPHRCTLAIGDHAEHEDLATGVKWSAGAERYLSDAKSRAASGITITSGSGNGFMLSVESGWGGAEVASGKALDHLAALYDEKRHAGETCEELRARLCRVHARGPRKDTGNGFRVGVDPAQPGTETTAFVSAAMRKAGESLAALGEAAKHAAESAMPVPAAAAIKWEMGTASLGQSQAHILRDGDVYRWQVNHLGLRIREGVEPHASPAMQRAGDLLRDVHEATAGIEWLAGFFGLLFRIHDATPAAKRAKQEAPLVALVAAVPEGLDPIGWRAAVLAVDERRKTRTGLSHYPSTVALCEALGIVDMLRGGVIPIDAGLVSIAANDAYRRAITPAAPVPRVRATWKTRAPVLAVDDGRDDD